jgi:hypothetical protein
MEHAVPSPTRRLADLLLGDAGPLEKFVQERRDAEPKVSWRRIAIELREATSRDGVEGVDLTDQTLRTWFPDAPAEAAS